MTQTGSESSSNKSSSNFESEFEKMLAGSIDHLRTGKIVDGVIVDMTKDTVTVDIGFKSEGVLPIEQFKDSEGKRQGEIGDQIEVMIIATENDHGQVVLSKERATQYRVWREVEEKFSKDEIVSGKVIQKVKGGLQVDIGIPAFLPGSQVDIRPHRNLDKFIGEHMDFKVLKISRDKGNIVVSRKAVLVNERDALRSETMKVLAEGVVLEGIVKNITDYGAFVDLGGIDGLLHITDISWGRVGHPSEKLSIGQKVPVVVIKYDPENQRVSLGMKQLKDDPWQALADSYPVNKKVSGKVINLTDYGAFVELEEGVDGLIHVSDMTWSKKAKHPSKILSEGDIVEAIVLGVDTEDKKISLGLKQAQPNPWVDFIAMYPKGTKVKGKVKSITEYGMFVEVADDIDGLVHVSDFSWVKRIGDQTDIQKLYNKGDEVEAVVLEVDVDNERLSLGIKQLDSDPWPQIVSRYPVGSKVKGQISSIKNFGAFVELEPGVNGLVHSSHLGLGRDENIEDKFKVGDELECIVTSIEGDEQRRIGLATVEAHEALSGSDQFSEYAVGEDDSSGMNLADLIRREMDKN